MGSPFHPGYSTGFGPLAGEQPFAIYTFTPPTIADRSRLTGLPQDRLWRWYKPFVRGVNVYVLADGTVVQDTPTPQNANSNVPYPIMAPDNTVAQVWSVFGNVNSKVPNPVVMEFYGGHTYTIPAAVAQLLTAAGYLVTVS